MKQAEHMTMQGNHRVEKKQEKGTGSQAPLAPIYSGRQSRPQGDLRGQWEQNQKGVAFIFFRDKRSCKSQKTESTAILKGVA